MVTSLVAFSGLTQENMTHNEGWHFLETGRRLERGTAIASLLHSTLVPVAGEQDENMVIEAVLGVTDSLITYRRRYRAGTRVGALLDLVLQDEGNPRALAYQLTVLERLVAELPRGDLALGRTSVEKLVLRSLTNIRLAEIDDLIQLDKQGTRRVALARMLVDRRRTDRGHLRRHHRPVFPSRGTAAQPAASDRDASVMKFRIQHVTRYEYAEPVSLCHSIAHLKPLEHPLSALPVGEHSGRSLARRESRARGFLRQPGQLFLDPAGA